MLAAVSGCRSEDPADALRADFAELTVAIEKRDAGEVASRLSEDFIGTGGLDKDGAERLAAAMFLRYRDVAVRHGPLEIVLHGNERATVESLVVLTNGGGGLLPTQGQAYRLRTGWRIESGQWRMLSAEWSPAT